MFCQLLATGIIYNNTLIIPALHDFLTHLRYVNFNLYPV